MKLIINPFLYKFITPFYVLIYNPYKHNFFKISLEEYNNLVNFDLDKIKEDYYIKNKILVEPNYKNNFINHYKKLIEEPKLNLMYLIITDSCNFKCPYCFIENNFSTNKRTLMTWEIAKKAIDYFLKNSIGKEKRIIFYGGEPTLNEEVLVKSIEYIRKYDKNIEIGINTNGSKYSKKLSEVFRKNNVVLSISLDSFPELNKFTRIYQNNKDATPIVENNIENYINDEVYVTLSITLNGYNIDYLPAFAKYISLRFPKIKSVGFNLSLENLKKNDLFVDPEYSAFQIYNSFRIFRKYGIYEDRVLRRLKHIVEENIYLKDCGACGNQITISPEGLVGPCHGFVGLKKYFENFSENYDFYNNEIIKRWNTLSPITNKNCLKDNCPFVLICGNSCPYYSYITKGSIKEKDNRMCKFLPIFINEIGKDLLIKKTIKYILIDYDGTIISRKPTLEILEEIKDKINPNYKVNKQNYYDIRNIITEMVKNSDLDDKSENTINNYIYLYLKLWRQKSKLNTPLLKQLEYLKEKYNLKIIIVSNSKANFIEEELKEYNKLFDKIIGNSSFKYNKKDKVFYEFLLKKLNINPEEAVYIGDSYFSDIKPFCNIGLRLCISFYANPELFHRLDNDWLVDIIEDAIEVSKK